MADILRVTVPLVTNKNQIPPQKQTDASAQFQLSDITKVIKTNDQEGLLQQNNTLVEQESTNLLMSMLKDPAATVSFIKGIFMLQEVVKLLPVNNESVTQEMSTLVNALFVKGSDVINELVKQENNSTIFKGALFDVLRELVAGNTATPNKNGEGIKNSIADVLPQTNTQNAGNANVVNSAQNQTQNLQNGEYSQATGNMGNMGNISENPESNPANINGDIANLLKAVNNILRNRDMLDSVSNNLKFLGEEMSPSKAISNSFLELAEKFRLPQAPQEYSALKKQAIALLADMQKSILYSDKLDRVSSITVYNLSRFNSNPDFLDDALTALLTDIPEKADKERVFFAIKEFINQLETPLQKENSKVMDVLAKIISMQAAKKDNSANTEEKIETIIQSLLSSPCNYTPLLHFVLPVDLMDVRSYAEIWIDPNEESMEQNENGEKEPLSHVLMAFEVEDIGSFELELRTKGEKLDVSLFCPTEFVDQFVAIKNNLARRISNTKYRLNNIIIDKMERPRSLMDVFETLPYRRAGIDVKI